MKKRKHHNPLLRNIAGLVKQELLAVIAVAVVLAFIFSQSSAQTNSGDDLVSRSSGTLLITEGAGGAAIFNGKSTLDFGVDIRGQNGAYEQWTGTVINLRDSLYAANSATVSISGVTNGTYKLYATGLGSASLNGVSFYFGESQRTVSGTVTIGSGKLTVIFDPNTEIYKIGTGVTSSGGSSSGTVEVPGILSIIPAARDLRVGSSFGPLVLVQNNQGQVISTPNLSWSSSDPKVAKVDTSGTVTAVGAGTATITVKVVNSNLQASLSVSVPEIVDEAPPVIEITPKEIVEEEEKEDTTDNALNKFVESLIGNRQDEATEEQTDDSVLDRLSEELSQEDSDAPVAEKDSDGATTTPSTGGATEGDLLDVYAQKQAEKLEREGTTTLTQREISEVVNQTQTTVINRVAATIQLGIRDVARGLGEIIVGSKQTVTTPSGETVEVKKPSAVQSIAGFIANLFGFGSSTPGSSAETTSGDFSEGEIN